MLRSTQNKPLFLTLLKLNVRAEAKYQTRIVVFHDITYLL